MPIEAVLTIHDNLITGIATPSLDSVFHFGTADGKPRCTERRIKNPRPPSAWAFALVRVREDDPTRFGPTLAAFDDWLPGFTLSLLLAVARRGPVARRLPKLRSDHRCLRPRAIAP